MTRGVWVDMPNDPDYELLEKLGITDPFFDGRWLAEKANPLAYLREVKKRLPNPGVFLCSQGEGWPSHKDTDPKAWADWAYKLVQLKIAPGTGGSFPLVDLNCEVSDPTWLITMLKRWRWHEPKRTTAWVAEAHKYPLFQNDFGRQLKDLGIIVKPECFADVPGAPMSRVESATEVLEWAKIVGVDRVIPCLDGSQVAHWWAGTAFTMGRLPR